MKTSIPNGKSDYVRQMFAAISRGDMVAFKACLTPDAVIWHNHDNVEQSVDETCQSLAYFCSQSTSRSYQDQRIVNAGRLHFVQHTLVAELKSGKTFRLPAMMRVEVNDDGRIVRIEEYFDGRALDALVAS